ncbi:LytR/AlgR family response regulator transcription factor [Mucilaginibacter myungsuensis]|uniref:Response regulator transcription factor n=1 Tax=Mucilaginibacter myungsuensis TaxID=649104 RepID=A0A929KW46_9SPHI|nr:LytTR family DNA-binding domain-containing protein [Mucilaginibacter myungsuensis]MBE9662694.1 response regulator transcription factor [Mucilaginibacter myungsuensis]MDN3598114.1 LytTR family DNA-binding domain-containing protein [Mucilaginibacter myungsuensis]
MKIKAIIVDDEPLAIEVIDTYLKNFGDVEVVAKCPDGIEAFRVLQQKKVDLAFLDVQMPGLKGTDLVRTLKDPPKVIFTTAYHDYAVEGFDLNAIDYLVKPIPFDRFLKAMDKVYHHFGINRQQQVFQETLLQTNTANDFIYLKADRKMIKVDVADILWIESDGDYIKVALPGRVITSKQKISILEELLPEGLFVRIHRSFIVAIDKVDSYSSLSVEIAGKEIPIGRNYKNDGFRKLRGN